MSNDSERLRDIFCGYRPMVHFSSTPEQQANQGAKLETWLKKASEEIPDGWEILGEADDGGSYESHLVLILRGPDGKLYEQESSHCSCYDHKGNWSPVETTKESLKEQLSKIEERQSTRTAYYDNAWFEALTQALGKLG